MNNAAGAAHEASIRVTYEWYCPACRLEAAVDHWTPNRFHTCPKMRGLMTVPMLRKGVAGKLTLKEREDYVGKSDEDQPRRSSHQKQPVRQRRVTPTAAPSPPAWKPPALQNS